MRSKEIQSNPPPQDLADKVNFKLKIFAHCEESYNLDLTIQRNTNHYEDQFLYTLLVHRVPRGEAPEEVRQAWQELIFTGCRKLRDRTRTRGIVTKKLTNWRKMGGFFEVSTTVALKALVESGTEKDYRAALWFLEECHLQPTLVFCADEMIILKRTPVNQSYNDPRNN